MIQQSHFWVYIQRIENRVSRYLHTHVHSSTIHNSQEVEATQVSMEQNVVHPYNGMLFSLKKGGDPDTGYTVDEP